MKCHRFATVLISLVTMGSVPLIARAQDAGEKPDASPAPVDLLHQAVAHLSEQKTIQTDLHQTITMFNKTLTVTGRYVKGPLDLQMRLDLNVQLPRSATDLTGPTSLLLLVDGQRMTFRESILGPSQNVTVDVKAVLNVLTEQKKENLRTMLIDLLGIGGLPQLLRGLDDTMDPNLWERREDLEKTFASETGHEVYVVQGQWRKELVEQYLPPPDPARSGSTGTGSAKEEPERELPPFQPTHVVLYLDRQTGLPHRIEYQHRDRKREKVTTIIVQECRDAKFGEEVPPEVFLASSAQSQNQIDMTDDWVDQLRSQPEFLEQLQSAAQAGKSPLSLIVPTLAEPSAMPAP
jgi:hypothetical protein